MSITGTIAVVLSTNKVTKTISIFVTVSLPKSTRRFLSAAIFLSIAHICAAVVILLKEIALAVVLSASKAAFAELVTVAAA